RREDRVQARRARGKLVQDDAGLVEPAHRLRDQGGIVNLHGDQVAVVIHRRDASREILEHAGHRDEPRGVGRTNLQHLAARPRLELAGCAAGDDPALVDYQDAVGHLVRFSVVPSEARSRPSAQSSPRLWASSPVVGSSRYSTSGRPTMLTARSIRRRMPPEYVLTLLPAASERPKRSISSAPRALASDGESPSRRATR